MPCAPDGKSMLHVVATEAAVNILQTGATSLSPLKSVHADIFAFVSVVNLANLDKAPCVKVVCHLCDSTNNNADAFLNPAWRQRVASTSLARLEAMSDSSCVHAAAIRRHKTDEMLVDEIDSPIAVKFEMLQASKDEEQVPCQPGGDEEEQEQDEEVRGLCLVSKHNSVCLPHPGCRRACELLSFVLIGEGQ